MDARPVRSKEVRRANERLVLRIMHNQRVVSQSNVVELTGLQASTVFRIFRTLELRGYIREVEAAQEEPVRRGRKPSYYSVNPNVAYAVGVDLSSRGVSVLVAGFSGEMVYENNWSIGKGGGPESTVSEVGELIREAIKDAGVELNQLLGVGIGAPGIVDIEAGRVVKYARFPGMEGFPLRERLAEQLGVPVHVHNNTSLIALSEYRYGRATGKGSLVAFLLRAGVGGAYIKDGAIFVSQGKTAFEAGHVCVNLSSGTAEAQPALEDYLAEDAILRSVRESVPSVNGWQALLQRVERRDERVLSVLRSRADMLAGAVLNIGLLLNPEAVLIITRFRALSQYLAEVVDMRLNSSSGVARADIRKVIPLQYDPIIACKGAVDLVFDDFFTRR